jgi:hypothetical protein
VTDLYGATVAKRRLSRRLVELRVEKGFTANQVCDILSWGRGKVGRFEANAWRRPEMSDIRDLLEVYQVDGEESRKLEALALLARKRAWWREYGDVYGESEFPGYEADAARISVYMPLIVPGLLQTQDYIEAQMSAGAVAADRRARALAARQRRQQILLRDDGTAPELVAVITEAPPLYRWGTPAQRRAQLLHLVEMSRRAHIVLRLLRFEDGLHPGVCGPINIFDFPGSEPPAVYLETDFAVRGVGDPDEVDAYIATFHRIRDAALDASATTAHLKRLADAV